MNALQRKQELLEAVRFGTLPQIKRSLQESGDVNALYPNGKTLLITAVERGDQDVIQHLIGAGADLNQRDFSDRTALMYAADKASLPVAQLLLDAGADVNAQNKQGRTALMYAVYKDAVEVTKTLLEAGAQVNIRDHKNQTALNYSDYKRAYKCQKILKEHGAEYAPKQKGGSGFRTAYANARTLDEFTELKQSPRWSCILTFAAYFLLAWMFGMQAFCGPLSLLFLLGIAWILSLTFPSVWKLVPLWREIRDRRTGIPSNSNVSSQPVRTLDPVSGDIEFVSQLMELGSHELSSIHRTHAESRSLPVLISLFNSRLRSVLLAVSIFLPVLTLFLPAISRTSGSPLDYFSTPAGILKIASFILLPLWIPFSFKWERGLRLERLRLVQQERDRIAGEVSTLLNAEDFTDKELPTDFGLYLRAFMTTDKLHLKGFDLETMLAYSIAPTLPLVALGKPGEHLGAGRIQTTDEHWQEEILRLMQCARLILIIPSHRAGTLWEIATLRDGGFLDKTIFIMPPELDFHGSKFSVDWHKTVLAAGEAGVEFPEHISAGAFFRLNADGGFVDYSPFVPEEFLRELDPSFMGGADIGGYDGGGDVSSDVGGADGIDGAVDSSSLGADGIDSGGDGGGYGGDGGGDAGGGGGDGGASGAG